jgi:hypothetical protein
MKKIFVILFVIIFAALNSFAQNSSSNSSDYKNAVGIKLYPIGVTIKHFISDKNAVEAIGYFLDYGGKIIGLYEIYKDIPSVPYVKWYFGPGAHLAFYNAQNGAGSALGIDGIIGLDYKFNSLPINLSLDWQPSIEFGSFKKTGFTGDFGGIAIRYTF